MKSFFCIIFSICLVSVSAFVPPKVTSVAVSSPTSAATLCSPNTLARKHTPSRLSMIKLSQDGGGRGLVLLSLVMLVNVWIFSIPPEFRRQKICSTTCEQNRDSSSLCAACVTGPEWVEEVLDYYRNGGGVHFDFSIAEETKAQWSVPGMK